MPVRYPVLAALPLILATTFATAQDETRTAAIFDRLDTDQSGAISPAEIAAAKDRQFARADTDGDGLVTQAELAAIAERLVQRARRAGDGLTERALRQDRNGDQALSRVEFTATSPLFILIDADANGAISRAELDRARAAFSLQP